MKAEILINDQIWMSKNLTITKFNNGEDIPFAKTKKELSNRFMLLFLESKMFL